MPCFGPSNSELSAHPAADEPISPHLVFMEGSLQKYDVSVLPVPGFGSSVPAQRGLHLVKKGTPAWLAAVSEDVTARDNPSHPCHAPSFTEMIFWLNILPILLVESFHELRLSVQLVDHMEGSHTPQSGNVAYIHTPPTHGIVVCTMMASQN